MFKLKSSKSYFSLNERMNKKENEKCLAISSSNKINEPKKSEHILQEFYFPNDQEMSEESFESTDQTDTYDSNENDGIKSTIFLSEQVVWAKKTLCPWLPGIIIEYPELNKSLIKSIGASLPTKKELDNQPKSNANHLDKEKIYLVLFFNKNKTWHWFSESKLRPFCEENDKLFLKKADSYYDEKYKKQVYKAYKKAKKFSN